MLTQSDDMWSDQQLCCPACDDLRGDLLEIPELLLQALQCGRAPLRGFLHDLQDRYEASKDCLQAPMRQAI